MKVLFVIPVNLHNQQQNTLKYSSFVYSEKKQLLSRGVNVEEFLLLKRHTILDFFSSYFKLRKIISEFSPSVIHVHNGIIGGLLVSMILNKKFIITFGGSEVFGHKKDKGKIKWMLLDLALRFLLIIVCQRASKIICVSSNIRKGIPMIFHHKIEVVPRGVDLSVFYPIDKSIVRNKLNFNSSTTYIVFSKIRPVKNYDLALAAIKELTYISGYDIKLIELKNLSSDGVRDVLNAADVLLITSLHEGSPNILKEAMACNLPVVTVDCGDVCERLSGSDQYFICEYDPVSIANKLQIILRHPSRSNGRSILIKQGLSSVNVSSKIYKIYSSIL